MSALSKNNSHQPTHMSLYGHGFYDDFNNISHLRRALFTGLSYNRNSSSDYYRTIKYEPGDGDPQSCAGDSGGPWKTRVYSGPNTSGVQFGVHASGSGWNACAEDDARAAMVAYHDGWIKDRVRDGRGDCDDTSHVVSTLVSPGTMTVSTLTCW